MDFSFIEKGGILMFFLFGVSVFGTAIILERFFFYRRINDFKQTQFKRLKSLIMAKEYDSAISFSKSFKSPIASLIIIALKERDNKKEEIIGAVELEGMKHVQIIYKYLNILKVLPNISTMLGLLGTVIGMIKNFMVVARVGTGDPTALAAGISEALITTATGLIIAIPLIFFSTVLENKANNIEDEMKIYVEETLRIL